MVRLRSLRPWSRLTPAALLCLCVWGWLLFFTSPAPPASAQGVAPPVRVFGVHPTTGVPVAVRATTDGLLESNTRAATVSGHSHTSAATITLTATTGQFLYITGIDIVNCAGATAVTAAAPTYITTTNLTGSPQYQLGSGATAGLCQPMAFGFSTPLRSTTAGTNVTFVLPTFATNQVASVNVYAYSAP